MSFITITEEDCITISWASTIMLCRSGNKDHIWCRGNRVRLYVQLYILARATYTQCDVAFNRQFSEEESFTIRSRITMKPQLNHSRCTAVLSVISRVRSLSLDLLKFLMWLESRNLRGNYLGLGNNKPPSLSLSLSPSVQLLFTSAATTKSPEAAEWKWRRQFRQEGGQR